MARRPGQASSCVSAQRHGAVFSTTAIAAGSTFDWSSLMGSSFAQSDHHCRRLAFFLAGAGTVATLRLGAIRSVRLTRWTSRGPFT
eukprot:4050391-Prymnesium_polylepis.1